MRHDRSLTCRDGISRAKTATSPGGRGRPRRAWLRPAR